MAAILACLLSSPNFENLSAKPIADFTATPLSGCAPLKIDFINRSTAAVDYFWNLGNTNTSKLAAPSAVYNIPGKYTVTLIVWDKTGATDTLVLRDFITVFKSPVAAFTADKKEVCAGDSVMLTDQSIKGDGDIVKYGWDLGNGDVIYGKARNYAWLAKGKYDISLAVTDENGCISTLKEYNYIAVNALPVVTMGSDIKAKCKAPVLIEFNSTASGTGPFSYAWDFGDSSNSVLPNPKHNYTQRGNYNVSLLVIDKNGCQRRLAETGMIKINPPVADFIAANTTICTNQHLQFFGRSTPADGSGEYTWNFGDGDSTNHAENPGKLYQNSGSYSVKLRYVWDKCTSYSQKPLVISVNPKPVVKLSMRDTVVCRNPHMQLKITASGSNIGNIQWYRDSLKNPIAVKNNTYTINQDTNRVIKIKVTAPSNLGCGVTSDSILVRIQGPFATAWVYKNMGCMPYNSGAEYTGKSEAPIKSYKWSCPPLNVSSTSKSVSFVNNRFGVNLLFLAVTDVNGCMDSNAYFLGAGIKVPADYTTDKKQICSNEPFKVINHSPIKSKDTVAFFWSWFNRDTIPFPGKDSAILKFRTEPKPKVRLTFTNNSYGCVTQDELFIDVMGPYLKGFVHPYCDKDTLTGLNQSSYYTSTWWRYQTAAGKVLKDFSLPIELPLTTKNLYLFAVNDTTHCKDSMLMDFNTDPQDAGFSYAIECKTHLLNTINGYSGVHDTLFTWTLTNATDGTQSTYRQRNLEKLFLPEGNYTLTLRVTNKKYVCTRSKTVKFKVLNAGAMKPVVSNISKSCFPVVLELRDDYFNNWKNPIWDVDKKTFVRDSVSVITLTYQSTEPQMWVHLRKSDDLGCKHDDSFLVKIGGPAPDIQLLGQNDQDCLNPVLSFKAGNKNPLQGVNYTYLWDFGTKKSNKQSDTVQMHGSGKLYVTLTISDDRGCNNSTSRSFQVKAGKPVARFKVLADTLVACPPLHVGFIDSSDEGSAPVNFRKWDFGDNTTSSKISTAKMYVIPGEYGVSLIVGNIVNCFDTFYVPKLAVVNGPKGSFKISNNNGCTPLNVNLSASVSKGVSRISFDMGDGVVLNNNNQNHQYTRAGIYVPRIILTDSNGCQFSPEPKDTIRVFARPEVRLNGGAVCANTQYRVSHSTKSADAIASIAWTLNGNSLGFGDSVNVKFTQIKNNYLGVTISSVNKCSDTANAVFVTYNAKAMLQTPKQELCLGNKINLIDKSSSDTNITHRWLYINHKLVTGSPYSYVANSRGIIPMSFIIRNSAGCYDSFSNQVFLKVGDTAAPPALEIYRSSVVDNFTTETRFAESREPDFKDQSLYVFRKNKWEKIATTTERADTNMLAKGLNTLNQSWCHQIRQRNFCGVETDSTKIAPHCTIETKAFGDTNASLVKWTPYIGWKNVAQYQIWRKPKNGECFALIDSVPGSNLSYNDTNVLCKMEYDYKIEGKKAGNYAINSFSDTAHCKPVHFRPVPAPEVWRTTVENNAFNLTEWVMPVKPRNPISYYSVYRNSNNGWELIADKVDSFKMNLQDHNTDVQNVKYSYYVTATDVCNTTSKASNVGRNIVLKVKGQGENQDAVLSWSPYIYWNEGVKSYSIERSIGGSSFIQIGEVDGHILSYIDNQIPKTCVQDIIYRVIATREQPVAYPDSSYHVVSVSNHSQYVPEIRFFVPNAFTPDANNLNEKFRPDGVFFSGYEMKIFNRWGQKVFDGTECLNAWDGTYENQPAPDGVYAYYIVAKDMGGKSYVFNGTITLLR